MGNRAVEHIELGQGRGLRARISNWGLYLTELWPNGQRDVVLSHADDGGRRGDGLHLGCIIGRHANRIRDGSFELDGWQHQLPCNAGNNHLHGGHAGFHQQFWDVVTRQTDAAHLRLRSPNGQEGYPGNLDVDAKLSLPTDHCLRLELLAVTDAPTPVNLTWHPYFNLMGHASGKVGQHRIQIDADHFLPMTSEFCPSGQILPVDNTPFDLRRTQTIAPLLQSRHPQLLVGEGFDHCFLIRGAGLRRAARLQAPDGSLAMEVWSTQPGLHFYTANTLMLPRGGKDGARYRRLSGVCLEPQGLPDAPNHDHFPSTILRPGQRYQQIIEYRFEVG